MQSLTAAPRDSLTDDQVRRLLVGAANVDYTRGCELLDTNLDVIEDISDDLQSGSISYTYDATVHRTCNLKLAREISYGTQFVRPYMTLTADGVSAKFYLGVFTLRKPSTTYGTDPVVNEVNGSDLLFLLNRPVGHTYVVAAATGYIAAVQQAVLDAGLTGVDVLIDGTASAKTLPTAQTWPIVATGVGGSTASGPTTWLQVINDLLAAIGYSGMWADENGAFRSEPYLDPVNQAVEFTFDFDDPYESIITLDRTVEQDMSDVPNLWVFLQSNLVDGSGNPIEPTEGAGQYTVTNQSDGLTSIDARNGLQWVSVVELDAADQASLVVQGNAQSAKDRRVAKVYTVKTAPFPAAGHGDIYTYTDVDAAGGPVKVQETEWNLDLGDGTTLPADMERTWEVAT